MSKLLLRWALWLHGFAYKLINVCALRTEKIHPKHRIMNYHHFFVSHVRPTDTVLDIGCGKGALAYDLAKKAKRVVGMDLNAKHKTHWETYTIPNLTFVLADATQWHTDILFDVVVLSNVLEHIEDRVTFLKKIRPLAPLFLMRVPLIDRDWITLYKKELGMDYRLDKTHFTEYTLDAFVQELALAGLHIEQHSIQFGELWAVVRSSSV